MKWHNFDSVDIAVKHRPIESLIFMSLKTVSLCVSARRRGDLINALDFFARSVGNYEITSSDGNQTKDAKIMWSKWIIRVCREGVRCYLIKRRKRPRR
jgi:hypothetical protein